MQVLVPLIHQVYMQELTDYIYQACNLDNVPPCLIKYISATMYTSSIYIN